MKRFLSCMAIVMLLLTGISYAEESQIATETLRAPGSMLRISELMASNKETLEDSFGSSSDWIEIVNISDQPFDMTGVCLSDSKKDLERYQFPDGLVLEPGQYIIVFASGLKKNVDDELHTPFKLSAAGESLHLTHDGVLLDSVSFGQQTADVSYALTPEDVFELTTTPTPGAENVITPPQA